MSPELRDILFLDIETVAQSGHFEELEERLKVQWARKAGFLKREANQTDADLYDQRAGIYAEFGKIVCIAVGMCLELPDGETGLRVKSYTAQDEHTLLQEFSSMLSRLDSATLRICAHNGKEFDFPYLCRRFLVNGLPIPAVLNLSGRKPWEVPHLDTMEMWKFGDHKHYTSLELLATIFDIPTSKDGMDGSQVNGIYHREGDVEKIRTYCMRDVVVLAQLFLRLKEWGLIKEEHIQYS